MGEIHPSAVKAFLKEPRDSHVWMKRLRSRELDEALDRVGFKPASRKVDPLQNHQKVCILLGIAYKGFAFWLDMGLGKTRIALELIAFWIREGYITGALILGRSESALIEWEQEIDKWRVRLPYITLLNSPSAEKWDELAEFEGGLILATYPGLARMLSVLKPMRRRKGKPAKNKLKINAAKVKKLCKVIGAFVTDESTELGNKHSLQYRVCNQLAKYCKIRYELAGIPFGKDPTMLWPQLYLVDRGETLGQTLGIFRAAFFKTTINYWGGYKHRFRSEMEPILNKILRHRSIQYRFEECGKLPKLVHKLEEVQLPEEATTYYEQFLREMKRKNAGMREQRSSFMRMRQASSGFVGFKNDETGERAEIEFAENPKLERLMELVDQVPAGRKFAIFHEFTYSGKRIMEELKKAKIKAGWIHGGIKNARELQDSYKFGNLQCLVVQNRIGAFSLNLQAGNYYFVYEAPLSAINDAQMRRRMRRKGQKKTVFGYDLVCRGTFDTRILSYHEKGGDLFDAIITGEERLK